MKNVTVAAAALNQTPLDWDGNRDRILAAIAEARRQGVNILCLPELCITGYGCEDWFYSPGVAEAALAELEALAPATDGMAVAVGLPVFHGAAAYNCCAVLVDRTLRGVVAKRYLAGDGVHYEPRWFRQWPGGVVDELQVGDHRVPIGDVLFDLGGVKLGVEVCRDAWVGARPGVDLARRGADVLLNPSGSHFALGKQAIRRRLAVEASRSMGVAFVFCNILGNEAGKLTYDGGGIIASAGKVVAEGNRFAFGDYAMTIATVDVDQNRRVRTQLFGHASPDDRGGATVRIDNPWPETTSTQTPPADEPLRGLSVDTHADHLAFEELTHALTLALWDYLRRSGSAGFVVSLSGGADSAAVATLVHLMAARALGELGIDGVRAALPRCESLAELNDDATASDLTGRLLTCVYQATKNSSATTHDAARQVADAVGAEFVDWQIDPLVEGYTRLAEEAVGRPLDWQTDDIALQNIQSRARAPGVWMLANLRGRLLLATGNRSEASVGYATMDGDTAGGLAPIGGVAKAMLLEWLDWLETEGPSFAPPLPALAAITAQQPTAELRPPAAGQTDESDLMPYPVLAAIEVAAIAEKRLPADSLAAVAPQFPDASPDQLRTWVTRFYRLWRQNQWKRERYAPAFHVDDHNVDPRSWCRFPILSAAFERELAALEDA